MASLIGKLLTVQIMMSGRSNPKPPHGITIVRGSAYGIFSRPFVEWLLTDSRPVDLLDWAKRTFSPDEFYWSTLHYAYANPTMRAPGSYAGERRTTLYSKLADEQYWFLCIFLPPHDARKTRVRSIA
jgi:hypothetical protein